MLKEFREMNEVEQGLNTNFQYMLAPIEDMTSCAFRSICHKLGADLTFTEMTPVAGLAKLDKNTWQKIRLHDNTPTSIQLLGSKEEYFSAFLTRFSEQSIPDGFKGFNFNIGCPNPNVISAGSGAALIRRISKVKAIAGMIKDHGFDISIKMRLGITSRDKINNVYLNLINNVDADFFIVHARFAKQNYSEPADNSVYPKCVATGKTIIANGDITTKEQVEKLKEIGIKGVMIGREAIRNPNIFRVLKNNKPEPVKKIINDLNILSEKYCEPLRYRKNILKWINKGVL